MAEWPAQITFFATLALYIATMYPDLTGGDAPELISAAVLGGVPHPPGYPTFCLVSRAFAALPFQGTLARRMNLCTSVLGAAAAALLHASVQLRTGSSVAGAAAAGLFGLSPLQWRYSVEPLAHQNVCVCSWDLCACK